MRPPITNGGVILDPFLFQFEAEICINGDDQTVEPSKTRLDGERHQSYDNSLDVFGRVFPPFRKISFWVQASGTFNGAVAWLCCIDASGIVATPGPFKHLDVSIYANCGEKLVVPVLDKVSDKIRTGHRKRYLYAEYSSVVSLVVQ